MPRLRPMEGGRVLMAHTEHTVCGRREEPLLYSQAHGCLRSSPRLTLFDLSGHRLGFGSGF